MNPAGAAGTAAVVTAGAAAPALLTLLDPQLAKLITTGGEGALIAVLVMLVVGVRQLAAQVAGLRSDVVAQKERLTRLERKGRARRRKAAADGAQ